MKNEQQRQNLLLKVDPPSTFRNNFLQPATNVCCATSWSRKVKNGKHRQKLATKQCCATSWGFLCLVFRRLYAVCETDYIRYGWHAAVRIWWTDVQVRVALRGFVMYRSGYAITLRLHADIHERKFFSQDWGEKRRKTRGTDEGPLHLSPGHTYPDIFQSATLSFRI